MEALMAFCFMLEMSSRALGWHAGCLFVVLREVSVSWTQLGLSHDSTQRAVGNNLQLRHPPTAYTEVEQTVA